MSVVLDRAAGAVNHGERRRRQDTRAVATRRRKRSAVYIEPSFGLVRLEAGRSPSHRPEAGSVNTFVVLRPHIQALSSRMPRSSRSTRCCDEGTRSARPRRQDGFRRHALYRHRDIRDMRDWRRRTARDRASKFSPTTYTSTATSAAWSTAPVSPWRDGYNKWRGERRNSRCRRRRKRRADPARLPDSDLDKNPPC